VTVPIAEIQKPDPSAVIHLFVLDATVCGGGVSYFATQTNALGAGITWQGQLYTPLPIQFEGFEWTSKGTLPRPKLRLAAVNGVIGAMIRDYDDLVGASVTLKRCFARHLDAVNFAGGVNPNADPAVHWDDEPWIIERKTLETSDVIEFELCTPMDQQNAVIPKGRVTANVCQWQSAAICPFSVGGLCGKKLANCVTHSTTDGVGLPAFAGGLPFGGFPGSARVR
jgi:lambda family phage minor tail protein L